MSNPNRNDDDEEADIDMPLEYTNGLRREMSLARSNYGEDNGVEEENSDNSGGSLSIGYNSFEFNFDSDEMNKIGDVTISSSSVGMIKDMLDDKTSEAAVDSRKSRGSSVNAKKI